MPGTAPRQERVRKASERAPRAAPPNAHAVSSIAYAPQQPDAAPASPELADQTLQSILQRAQLLTADRLNAQARGDATRPPAVQSGAIDGGAPAFGYLQRKTTKLTPVATLQEQTSLLFKDEYDKLVTLVETYLDDTNAPENAYGRRLRYVEAIATSIGNWETMHGPVDQAVGKSLFKSTADKRRPLLKSLKDSLPVEEDQVQQDGLTQAKAAHKIDREKLTEYLDEAASSDERMLRNTAEWFKLGKAKLYAVTPTGDSEARIHKAKMNVARDEAWFPKGLTGSPGDILSAEVKYNEKSLTDNTNVQLDQDGKVTGGWNVPGVVTITNPAKKTKATVWETLRHEVQHDADFNKGRDAGAGVHTAGKAFDASGATLDKGTVKGTTSQLLAGTSAKKTYEAEVALTRYKTEYRAYSYQEGESNGKYAKLDNSVRNKLHGGKMFTERQLEIFKHIYGGYDYTKTNWDADTPLTGARTFRDEVANYWNPDTEAFNKYNSPRVDDFYRALDAIGVKEAQTKLAKAGAKDVGAVAGGAKVSDLADPGVVKLLAATDQLNGEDGESIFNESPAMIKKIKAHLDGEALKEVMSRLDDLATFVGFGDVSLFD